MRRESLSLAVHLTFSVLLAVRAAAPTTAPTCGDAQNPSPDQNTGTACIAGSCFAAGQHCVGFSLPWEAGSCYCTDTCFENGACVTGNDYCNFTSSDDCGSITNVQCRHGHIDTYPPHKWFVSGRALCDLYQSTGGGVWGGWANIWGWGKANWPICGGGDFLNGNGAKWHGVTACDNESHILQL